MPNERPPDVRNSSRKDPPARALTELMRACKLTGYRELESGGTMSKRKAAPAASAEMENTNGARLVSSSTKPLVFVSHDSRDAELAEAFSNMLTDASAGVLKSFRSSDKKGASGIDYGSEWYTRVMDALAECTDVVALLTQNSLDRPWILFEAGVAKGRGQTSVVFGVTLGIRLEKAISGPFSQFQNCGDEEDDLTKLVMQLLRRVPDSDPREAAVRMQVRAFREKIAALLKDRAEAEPNDAVDDTAVVKLFEEVKVLFRDLPQQVEGKLRDMRPDDSRWRRRRFHPGMIGELLHGGLFRHELSGSDATAWLLFVSLVREDVPWFYELGMEVYRAMRRGNSHNIERAIKDFQRVMRAAHSHPIFRELAGPDKESYMLTRELPMMADDFLQRYLHERIRYEASQNASNGTSADEAASKDGKTSNKRPSAGKSSQ